MAVISKIKTFWNGAVFLMIIKYDAGRDYFSIALPPEVVKISGDNSVTASTRKEVEAAFHKALADYRNKKKVITKVIGYNIQYQIDTKRGRKYYNETSRGFDENTELEFDYLVFNKTDFEGNISYSDSDGDFISDNEWEHIVVWTDNREQFFNKFKTAMEDLIIQVLTFFGEKKELLKKIDSGLKMLPYIDKK